MKKLISFITIIVCVVLCASCKPNNSNFNCDLTFEGVISTPSVPITSTFTANVITDTVKIKDNDIVYTIDDIQAYDAVKWLDNKVKRNFTNKFKLNSFYKLHALGTIEDKRLGIKVIIDKEWTNL